MIIVGGYKVFPRDVEEVLFRHPDIQNCAVVGIPDPRTTERVRAYVVLKEGKNTTAEELLEYCSKNLAKYRVPREIEIRSNLPLTAVGKVLRRELRQEAIASEKGG
ncbi:MAG TPA: long-chain fatty acid--CoA ligase, partial [Candidatus Hodarchaeales archaeon]|nr:long-chain fatty acid--CoA ligase [Candidatus Hodarchaeales archaeon]